MFVAEFIDLVTEDLNVYVCLVHEFLTTVLFCLVPLVQLFVCG